MCEQKQIMFKHFRKLIYTFWLPCCRNIRKSLCAFLPLTAAAAKKVIPVAQKICSLKCYCCLAAEAAAAAAAAAGGRCQCTSEGHRCCQHTVVIYVLEATN